MSIGISRSVFKYLYLEKVRSELKCGVIKVKKYVLHFPLCCCATSLPKHISLRITPPLSAKLTSPPEGEKIEQKIYIDVNLDEHFPPIGGN